MKKPNAYKVRTVVDDIRGKNFSNATVVPYICALCDNTHLRIIFPNSSHVEFVMSQQKAEALVSDILNPKPEICADGFLDELFEIVDCTKDLLPKGKPSK